MVPPQPLIASAVIWAVRQLRRPIELERPFRARGKGRRRQTELPHYATTRIMILPKCAPEAMCL